MAQFPALHHCNDSDAHIMDSEGREGWETNQHFPV